MTVHPQERVERVMDHYGVRLHAHGFQFRSDGRRKPQGRRQPTLFMASPDGHVGPPKLVALYARKHGTPPPRGNIRAFSWPSARRLEFAAANAGVTFRLHVTLTYHGREEECERVEDRNRRFVRRSKRDLGRFLNCVRGEIGAYLWVQEFQERGVVHYHLLCELEVPADRLRTAWLRSIGSLDDPAAIKHGVRVETISDEVAVRRYLGRYLGKLRQKTLPIGVTGAGRWWGASKGLLAAAAREFVSCWDTETVHRDPEQRIARVLRKFAARCFGRRIRGGPYSDWPGEVSARLIRAFDELESFYGRTLDLPPSLEGTEPLELMEMGG